MKCNVCRHEFTPKKENKYIASQRTAPMFGLTKYYDCFDCPKCGCQIVAQERYEDIGRLCECKCENDCSKIE